MATRSVMRGGERARYDRCMRSTRIRWEYPEHLREQVQAAPAAPGVYVFHGELPDLPLYIGKSVNLRSRLLAHLRNRGEARLLRQARRISLHRTAGEIGALLLEARLVKCEFPLYNRRLRRNHRLCTLKMEGGRVVPVDAQTLDFQHDGESFGLFRSRAAALAHVQQLADAHQLCGGRLGLEALPRGRPCMRSLLGRCAGVCHGREAAEAHDARLARALSSMAVRCWPWPGAVALTERGAEITEIHVVRNWCHLGTVASLAEAEGLSRVRAEFDADCYRILCKPLLSGDLALTELTG